MKKYTQLALIVICIVSVLALLVCERRYANMKVILEVMDVFETKDSAVKCERQIEALRKSHFGSLSSTTPAIFPVWKEVLGGAFSVYSAFWDCESEQNASRVVVAFENSLPPELRCFIWFDHRHHVEADSVDVQVLDVQGTSSTAVLECLVRNVSLEPLGVSFSTADRSVMSHIISLQPTSGNATSNFSVCVPPLASSVTPLALAEFTIYHRHIGVEDFVFFDGDALPNAKRLLAAVPATTYATLTILPWNVPAKFADVAESARIADCLLRTKRRSRNTVFLDTNQFVSLYQAKDLNQLSRGLSTLVDADAIDQVTLFHTHYFCDEFSDDVVASSLDIKFVTQRKVRYHRVSEKHSVFLVKPGFSKAIVAALRNPNHPVEGNVLVPERSAVVNVYRECRSLFPVRNTRENYVPDMQMTRFRGLLYTSKLYRYFEKQPYASLLL
uniref:Glycosyltransferase family 92 protein n=1 Tax=Ixodes ricinus TaxID=34613 RepID=V5GZF2_IXORI